MKIRKYFSKTETASKELNVQLIGGKENYCNTSIGFRLTDNWLERGVGVAVNDLYNVVPADVYKAYYSSANGGIFAVSQEGVYLYYTKLKKNFAKIYSQPEKIPYFFDVYNGGMDSTIIAIGEKALGFTGYTVSNLSNVHEFYTGTMHCGRFFGRDRSDHFRIWWSSTGGFLDWTEGIDGYGYMVLSYEGGEVLKLMNYGEKLLAIRERGITIIKAYGEPQHYVATESVTYLTADDIVAETCTYCGGNLMFCTTSGIFAYDGNDIERQLYDGDIYDFKSAVALGDRYYVICSSKKLGEGLTYIFESDKKQGYFVDIKPNAIIAAGEVTAFLNDGIYTFSEGGGRGVWKSREVDFGVSAQKRLKKIKVKSDGDITITIAADGVKRTFAGDGIIRTNMSGRSFNFEVSGSGNLYELQAFAEVRG